MKTMQQRSAFALACVLSLGCGGAGETATTPSATPASAETVPATPSPELNPAQPQTSDAPDPAATLSAAPEATASSPAAQTVTARRVTGEAPEPAIAPVAEPQTDADVNEPIDSRIRSQLEGLYRADELSRAIPYLKHPNIQVRRAAIARFRYRSDVSAEIIEQLLPAARDRDAEIRSQTLECLAFWIRAQRNSDAATESGPPPAETPQATSPDIPQQFVQTIIAALDDPEERIARQAVEFLAFIGPSAAPAAPRLIPLIQQPGVATDAAIRALGEIGPAAIDAAPHLVALLQNPDYMQPAATALGRMQQAEPLLKLARTDVDGLVSATEGLSYLTPATDEIIQLLIQAAQARQPRHRSTAAEALGRVRPANEQVVETLGHMMNNDPDEYVAGAAADALVQAEPKLDSAFGLLLDAANSGRPHTRSAALRGLAGFQADPALKIAAFARAAIDENWSVRSSAEEGVRQLSTAALPLLLGILKNKQAALRERAGAAFLLQSVHMDDYQKLRDVRLQLLRDESESPIVRAYAANGYDDVDGSAAPHRLSACVAALRQTEFQHVRVRAAEILQESPEPEAVEALVSALKDPHIELAQTAAGSLRVLGPSATAALPVLLELARDPECEIRNACLAAIGGVGVQGRESYPVLLQIFQARDDREGAAAQALAQVIVASELDADEAVAAMISALQTLTRDDSGTRADIMGALQILGADAAPAIPTLLGLLANVDGWTRSRAAETLGAIGEPAGSVAVEAIAAAIRREPADAAYNRAAMLSALLRLNPPAELAVPLLAAELDSEQNLSYSLQHLGGYAAEAQPAVPGLIRVLDHPNPYTRLTAVHVLAAIGPPAGAAAEKLDELSRDDEDPQVREAAAQARQAIAAQAASAK